MSKQHCYYLKNLLDTEMLGWIFSQECVSKLPINNSAFGFCGICLVSVVSV